MSDSMGDLLYERKFNEMQMYIPFLTRVIDKLQNNEEDKPRKAQLEKMKVLHDLLTNNQKKLKIDTLLKCESVLKKLHAKIEKSDELSPPKAATKPSPAAEVAAAPQALYTGRSPAPSATSSPLDKHLLKGITAALVNTCPASPTQFGDVDFRPPVEIPTERRGSPIRTGGYWEHQMSNRSPGDSGRNKINSSGSHQRPPAERQRNRWNSPAMNASTTTSSHHNNSWPSLTSSSSSSSSSSSAPASSRRSVGQQRYDSKQKESSEEENWDDPEDDVPVQPKPPPLAGTVPPSSAHRKHWETSHGSHQQYQQRHADKSSKHSHDQLAQPFNPKPDISLEQKKLFHDTIFKYKKPDPPAPVFNPYTNPPPPEPPAPPAPSSNIFNRLGDKVESGYENFRIQVKNDKVKPSKPAAQLPPALPSRPIDEVLKSPPLSADDIDDLLNESLEAAQWKPAVRPSASTVTKESKAIALELVRKKLAMISRVSPTGLESPLPPPPPPQLPMPLPPLPPMDADEKEPFYRRGQTPTKKEPQLKSQLAELTVAEPSPQSPPSVIDPIIKRLALKYHPHRRFDAPPELPPPPTMHKPEPERLALKYNPHPRRETMVSPLRIADPRISKSMGQLSPLVASPPAVGPVINVLPSINPFDPRLRNSRLVEPMPAAQFCTSLPSYPPTIPRLLDMKVSHPLAGPSNPKPLFGMPARLDPRTQKPACTVYADKFNPERNDQTERMKYLESKKKKPPEPKTYKEYRQSKSRQLAAESAPPKPVEAEEQVAAVPPAVPSAPSTLDKMYRSMEYGKDLGKVTQGFKIPKKPKPEDDKPEPKEEPKMREPKTEEPKTEEPKMEELKTEELKTEEPKTEEPPASKATDELTKKPDEPAKSEKKDEKPAKKEESPTSEKLDESTIETESNVNEVSAEAKADVNEQKGSEDAAQSPKILADSLQVQKIKYEAVVLQHDVIGDILDESQSQDALIIDENKDDDDTSSSANRRLRGRPKAKKPDEAVEEQGEAERETPTLDEKPAKETPPAEEDDDDDDEDEDEEEDEEEEEEEEIKPRRIRTRRSTLFIDEDDDTSSPTAILMPFRSAAEIFGPSTDNSIVSTQNIISGKRRTRAAINFNEKAAKKPVTPKTTPANSPAPTKAATKCAQKTSAKKGAVPARRMTRSKSVGKRVSDSGQICAVSSTTSQSGDAEESHNEDSNAPDEVTPEEPSSSGSKPQTPLVDAEETQKRQEWLEGFLESIVDPSTNKDRILQMLKAVLDEKKLQQVKDILYSPDDSPEAGGETSAAAKKQETNKTRPKKKNELDRLNDDIRDMFICQGVMTATGRRMCTLAKEGSKDKPAAKRESPKERKAKESPPAKEPPHTATKESARSTPVEEAPKAVVLLSLSDHKKHIRRAKVTIKPINLRTLRSRIQKQSPTREMPVLEPNTPIKLPEEKEADEAESDENAEMAKNNRKRPASMSKRVAAALALESDDDELDDDIELIHLKKKIRKQHVEEPVKADNQTDELEGEEEAKPEEEPSEPSEEIVENPKPEPKEAEQPPKSEKVAPPEELSLKNVNPEWHTMSDYASCCVICKEKPRFIAPHYLTAHNNSEVYTSRLPPSVLEDIKQGVGNRALYSISKKPNLSAFHYRCPFCDFQATNTLRGWMEHFTSHTGEYQYKCSACFKAMNGCTHMLDHIKRYCPEAKKVNREPINLRGHTINGYVCHLCSFIQMLHSGVVKHLEEQHNLTDTKSIGGIIKVHLIESAGVPKMEENTEMVEQSPPEAILPPPVATEPPASKQSNLEVFLSRELASPTSDVLTERLKSIDQDEGITSDSSVNTNSQFGDGPGPAPRMTIAERLSQRFKNIEKQNNMLDEVRVDETQAPAVEQVEQQPVESHEEASAIPMELELPVLEEPAPVRIETPPQVESELPGTTQSIDSSSVNESTGLVIDEEAADDSGSERVDEDDNDNWEDIEITETKGSNAKDKNKNNSIFQTLSRLYASIAPKKSAKKSKEKKKPVPETNDDCSQEEHESTEPSLPIAVPSPQPTCESALVDAATTSQPPAAQISNLDDLLPDSPSDSLDMLLETNFNCLEGDGTSFPHLDLNDLESPLFLMPEDQTNLQDAMALATDLDLVDPLPALAAPRPPPPPPPPQPLLPPPPKQMPGTSVQRIGNVGFSLPSSSVKYYCMVAACTFLFSDHPDGLQNHFLLEHPTLRWNGYCDACQAQVCADGSREMQHMLEVHSNAQPAAVEKPRIKFRRLTGDILSTDKKLLAYPPPPLPKTAAAFEVPPLSLTSLLQSEPRAMIPPTPPVGFAADIPLYKNVSKEFTITGVAEGVTENDLRNLVINQSETTPGGMQISQVISLNAGGKSLSSRSSPAPYSNITFEHGNAATLNEFRAVLQLPPEIPLAIVSPPIMAQVEAPLSQLITAAPIMPTTPFKCCAKNCKFSSYMRSSMHDHIEFHMRTDKDRAAFKCHECGFEGLHTVDYFRHMEQGHHARVRVQLPSTNDLTQKIQNILRSTTAGSNPVEEVPEKDPLSLETSSDSVTDRIKVAAEEMTADTGLPDDIVWKCPIAEQCKRSINEKDFQTHISKHLAGQTPGAGLTCPHCPMTYQRPAVLRAHIKTHSQHRYFCYVCCHTFFNYQQSQKHFSESHARTSHVQVQALVPDKDLSGRPFLVFNLEKLSPSDVLQFGEKLRVDWERKKASNKTHFKPNEQNLLPLQPIFNSQVYCSVCNYKTKVRTNMFRHLQLHGQEVDVASVDPVNPVPCLEKNEKHFDKMLNLACSSNATGGVSKPKDAAGVVKVPAFVPDMKRYVCGHPGCAYLTITDTMLRSHLNALHGGERGYQCPHCQEDICKKTMCAERIVQHLKFHGPKIYQCGECEYLHYTRYVVERHIHDKHSAVPSTNMMSFDRTETEVTKTTQVILGKGVVAGQSSETDAAEGATTSASHSSKFKWECALCKFQTMTWNQMISHVNSVHRARHQYHCVHCTFGAAHLAHIMEHIDAKHPSKTREAKYLFYKINETPQDKAADTRPLWTRDDPKRVRSIRGILMENEEDAERTKQSLSKSGVDLDDEDDDVEFVQFIEPEAGVQPGVLGCFHCDFKAEEMSFLASHWRTTHWHVKNAELVPEVPFFFRIHSILKCVSCAFVGDHVTVQQHAANKHGQRTFYAADPKLPYTCGHCPYVYPPKQLDDLARHYLREHRRTDVKNLSTNLLKNILALGECQVYMQCYFCAEICADKTAIIEHERDRHSSSNFRYKQIKDEVIYRCGMCHYSSTNEMATLRHMVDHFGGFGRCHFCKEPQGSFNAYMQHCYAAHARDLKRFKEIYTLTEMTTFLGQMLLIFPNGLIVDKKNLVHTQYGSTERISAMYEEICKKALEPPIPPLCMARLIAKRSFEASESKSLGPSPTAAAIAKRIAKRRSTVAMGIGDRDFDTTVLPGPAKIRKRKSSISADDRATAAADRPLFNTVRTSSEVAEVKALASATNDEMPGGGGGFSFYGRKPESLDLSKIYTQIAIADKYAPVSVKKFALLFKINTKVVVDKMDFTTYQATRKRSRRLTCKPCPASEKWRHI